MRIASREVATRSHLAQAFWWGFSMGIWGWVKTYELTIWLGENTNPWTSDLGYQGFDPQPYKHEEIGIRMGRCWWGWEDHRKNINIPSRFCHRHLRLPDGRQFYVKFACVWANKWYTLVKDGWTFVILSVCCNGNGYERFFPCLRLEHYFKRALQIARELHPEAMLGNRLEMIFLVNNGTNWVNNPIGTWS